jgi:cytochrome P450
MGSSRHSDWDPRSRRVQEDQIAAFDELRRRCPVAYSEYLSWSLLRHADVMRVLRDHSSFSNAVSSHLSVPNGMDPPLHTAFRRIIDPYFGPQRMQAFEPRCRQIATSRVARLPNDGEIELMGAFALEFAVRIQCGFLGWPDDMHESLRQWIRRNHEATLAGERAALAAVALEFDDNVRVLLAERRRRGAAAPEDITDSLLRERIGDRPLADEEIVSILRNWTVGELGTIASCVGILAHYLANHPALQRQLREQPALLPAAIDEILRIHAPLIANRRRSTRSVEFDDRTIETDERISLIWASANRDEAVFGDPDEFRLDRDPALNLLYGAGIHVCPGAPLARLELRVLMEELLQATREIAPMPGKAPLKAAYPASGFVSLPLWIAR